MNGYLLNDFNSESVRSFCRFRTGSELVEGLRIIFPQNHYLLSQPIK